MTPTPCPSQTYVYNGQVTRIIDGDTAEITVQLGFYLTTTQRFRLVNVNAPEMRGPSRPQGMIARDFAAERLLGMPVVIRTTKSDAFGRWLVHIWVADMRVAGNPMVDFNAELVERGYAVGYREGDGGV